MTILIRNHKVNKFSVNNLGFNNVNSCIFYLPNDTLSSNLSCVITI